MLTNHFYEIFTGLLSLAGMLALYIYRSDKKQQEEKNAEIMQLITKNSTKVEEVVGETNDIVLNYNNKFAKTNENIADVKFSVTQVINESSQAILKEIATLKERNADQFVTSKQCSAFHHQNEIEIENIKDQITVLRGNQ